MQKIMRVLVSALLVSINLFGSDSGAFEEKARAFLAGIDWSKAGGFSLRIRADKAPLVLCDAKRMNVKMGALVGLGNGKTYTLTNGRGRMQTFSVESKVNPVDWMKGALTGDVSFLTVDIQERVLRDGATERTSYVLSSNGKLFDVECKSVRTIEFPLVFRPREEKMSNPATDVRRAAEANRLTAMVERQRAVETIDTMDLGFHKGMTNGVYVVRLDSCEIERLRRLTKDGLLGPVLSSKVRRMRSVSAGGRREIVVDAGPMVRRVREIIDAYELGDERRMTFYRSGNVLKIVDAFSAARLKILYCYEESGRLKWMIQERKGIVDGFWWFDGKELVPRTDFEMAYQLVEGEAKEDQQ